MSRSQMEIFGLVIIIILIALGLLLAVIFITKPGGDEIVRVKESVMVSNYLNTVLGTSAIGCGKRTVRECLQDCARSASVCENGKTTCEFAEEIIRDSLRSTLGKWGKDYQFFIEGPPRVERIDIRTSECTGEVEGASRPEKAGMQDMMINLRICR